MSDCTAEKHGNESAYRQGCRCQSALDDRRTRQKLRDAGLAKPAYTDPTGTARRLQALAALGWAGPDLAARLDAPDATVMQARSGKWQQVRADFAEKVHRVYEELQGTPGGNERTRAWAEKSGFAPPLLWHDRNIDDPAAEPERDRPAPQRGVDLAEVRFLESCSESRDEIAKQMGVQVSAIERAEYRAQARVRDALAAPAGVPAEWVAAREMGDHHAMAR
jgi:hypothetical protein